MNTTRRLVARCTLGVWLLFGPAVLVLAQGELTAHFLNVGQGDCTLLVFPSGKRLLVDCGSTDGPFDPAKIRDYIARHLNPSDPKIDLLVITHPDADHYNRIPAVLGEPGQPKIRVERVLLVGEKSDYGSGQMEAWLDELPEGRLQRVHGQEFNTYPARPLPGFENERVAVLAANVSASFSASNAKSVVLKASFGDFDLMITGDATKDTDASILERFAGREEQLDVEVWKAAHHGSWATASHNSRWAAAVRAEVVVFSASATNDYGHPNRKLAEVFAPYTSAVKSHRLLLWEGANAKASEADTKPYRTKAMYSTSSNGNIVVKSDGRGFRVDFGVN